MDLDKLVKAMKEDGGEWREVRFWTKESTAGIFQKGLSRLNGIAEVSIYNGSRLDLRIHVAQPKSKEPRKNK